jgi:Ser/Thr protein kinase RdoA (MazF antagonist)
MLAAALRSQPPNLNGTLTTLVGRCADEWFARDSENCRPANAWMVSRTQRRVSVIYRLRATAGDQHHNLVAKQYWDWLRQTTLVGGERIENAPPRLFVRCHVDDKAPFEYAALAAIHENFSRLGDQRFGAVRPLAVLPGERTILMEELHSVSLARMLSWRRRMASSQHPRRLSEAFRHAGAWLRQYHALPPLSHTRPRHAEREEFIDSVQRVGIYLAEATGHQAPLDQVTNRVSGLARSALPSQLPLGLAHTDFAPRNVLVNSAGGVAAIDTLGRWQAPLYEDVGYFLVGLQTAEVQIYSQGWWLTQRPLQQFEAAFLEGYFESCPVPRQAVRLFEIQSLLYRWAAIVHGSQRSAGLRRLVKRCRLVAQNCFMLRHLRRLLKQCSS